MQFNQYPDPYYAIKKEFNCTREDYYEAVIKILVELEGKRMVETIAYKHYEWERNWVKLGKPYYRVYPSIIPMLTRLDLSKVVTKHLMPPNGITHLHIELPVSQCLGEVQSIFIAFPQAWVTSKGHKTICVGYYAGESSSMQIPAVNSHQFIDMSIPMWNVWFFELSDITVADAIDQVAKVAQKNQANSEASDYATSNITVRQVMQLAATLCLLGSDPDLIKPEVLNTDESKLEDATPERMAALIAKAKRRGKYGFSIGKTLETIPHYRRPHPALVHTGKGRVVPKIVMRKGTIVHREIIEKVPTGYHGNQPGEL
jgi:hypothetical protein